MSPRNTRRFPRALRASAVPRWSHRDPVEAGNPFPPSYARAEAWKIATEIALHALRHHDRALGVEPQILHVPDRYSVRVQDLAVARFNIWAKRGLAAIDDKNALPEYGEWLETYVTNWLAYVTDTCPKLDVRQSLHERLAERTVTWVDRAWSIARD